MNLRKFGYSFVSMSLIFLGMSVAMAVAQPRSPNAETGKEIAITIDDLPLNGPPIELKRLKAMTSKLLAALKKYHVPAVGFVNESLLYTNGETDDRIQLLREWRDAGVELGNHTFSHIGFKDHSLSEYEDDFVRGDAVTRLLLKEKGQTPRYFRHPFLQMGPTREAEISFEKFIEGRGYKIVPITADTMDWMYLFAYKKENSDGRKTVAAEYLKFAAARFEFTEQTAEALFGRQIPQILLLHANELNADNFDALLKLIADRGYRFVTVEQALKDPAYVFPNNYSPTSDWLTHWASSKKMPFDPPSPPQFIQKAFADGQK